MDHSDALVFHLLGVMLADLCFHRYPRLPVRTASHEILLATVNIQNELPSKLNEYNHSLPTIRHGGSITLIGSTQPDSVRGICVLRAPSLRNDESTNG
jgi:hypothetical protein